MVEKEKEETAARADQSESASDLEKTEAPGAFAKMEVAASSVRFPDENPFSSWRLQGAPFQRLRPAWYDLAPLADFPFVLPQRPVEETGGPAACGRPAPAVCTEAAEPCVVPFESASVQATLFEFPEETPPEAAKGKRSVHRASPPMIEPVLPGLGFERDVPESLPTLPAVD